MTVTKAEFILALRKKLSSLPAEELEERLTFYIEMIEDRMEEGLLETEAVAAVGSVEEIAAQILADTSPAPPLPESAGKQRTRNSWTSLLLILGSPIWICLAIAAFAVIFSLYVSLWAVLISLWAIFISCIACAFGCLAAGLVLMIISSPLTGTVLVGGGLVCAGLAIFLFFGCKAATKVTLLLTKKLVMWRKRNG